MRNPLIPLLQRLTGQSCVVLLYHSVPSGQEPEIAREEFAFQMDLLADEFKVLSADEFLWYRRQEKKPPAGSILITFDDGYQNNFSVVQPIMQERSLPWVVFVTTSPVTRPETPWICLIKAVCLYASTQRLTFMNRTWEINGRKSRLQAYAEINRWTIRLPADQVRREFGRMLDEYLPDVPSQHLQTYCRLMTPEQLRELAESGLVEVGSHTHTHPRLTQVPDQELARELEEPTNLLSEWTGRRVRMHAYPFGCYGRRELRYLEKSGLDCAFAVKPNFSEAPHLEIPRVGIYNPSLQVLRAKCAGASTLLEKVGIQTG